MLIHHAGRALAGTLIMAGCALAQFSDNANSTPTSITTSSSLPPIGIGGTETAQVILTNTATGASATPTTTSSASSNGTAASCTGSVSFHNATGAVIGTATSFTLTSGQIAQVSLPYASAGSSAARALIRAVVSLTITFPSSACSLSYSLATFDTVTGVTHTMLAGNGISGIVTPSFSHP